MLPADKPLVFGARDPRMVGGVGVADLACDLGTEDDNTATLGSDSWLCRCAASSGAWAPLVGDRFLVH